MKYLFAIYFNVSDVVLKHSGDVDLWELVLTEDDEQTGLPTSTISNDHQLLPDGCHLQTECTLVSLHIKD